ncbi:MAG: penicillin-binding protein activator [Deltaproteobacteria bacterium]|nr:penicillin-binding protein activator [Deltaproteobacteria bacterium]
MFERSVCPIGCLVVGLYLCACFKTTPPATIEKNLNQNEISRDSTSQPPGNPLGEQAGAWHNPCSEEIRLANQTINNQALESTTIGVLLPLSGRYAAYGKAALEGIKLGAGVFTEPGPGGRELILEIRDTAGDPDQTVAQLEKLVTQQQVIAVIGPIFKAETRAAAKKAEELEVPLITLSGLPDIAQTGAYVFRNFITLEAQARSLVSYSMQKLGVEKFAVVYPANGFGLAFAEAFKAEVGRHKGEIPVFESYPPDTKDFSKTVRQLIGLARPEERPDYVALKQKIYKKYKKATARKRALKRLARRLPPLIQFQAIFVADDYQRAAMIAPALANANVFLHSDDKNEIKRYKKGLGRKKLKMVYLLGGEGWNHPELIRWAKRYVQGAVFCDGFFSDSSRDVTRLFVDQFRANYDHDPDMIGAHAYDSARILKTIIEDKLPPSRLELRDQLLELKGFMGVTGRISFDENGDVEKELFLLTVKKKKIVELQKDLPAT